MDTCGDKEPAPFIRTSLTPRFSSRLHGFEYLKETSKVEKFGICATLPSLFHSWYYRHQLWSACKFHQVSCQSVQHPSTHYFQLYCHQHGKYPRPDRKYTFEEGLSSFAFISL